MTNLMGSLWGKRARRVVSACSTVLCIGIGMIGGESKAASRIKSPGAYPRYAIELEPHVASQMSRAPWPDDGIGIGVRASFPIVDIGPFPRLNNSMALGFGVDWAYWGDVCEYWWGRYSRTGYYPNTWSGYNCSANAVWVPVVIQWNLWLTDVISVFAEPGISLSYHRYHYVQPCPAGLSGYCGYTASDTNLNVVMWGGARFMFSDDMGLTLRLGSPSVSVGLSLML